MTVQKLIEIFESHQLIESLKTVERNGFLKKAGTIDTHIYYIESGSLKIFVLDDEEERIVRFGYAGNIIVSLDSFLTQQPSDFYIQALKKTVVKIIPKNRFYDFMQSNEAFTAGWIKMLEDLIVQQMEREKDLLTQSPQLRYERVLQRSPRLFQEVANKHIANYLRMTPETLSRLKKR